MWTAGVYVQKAGPSDYFSKNNWGTTTTQYINPATEIDDADWSDILFGTRDLSRYAKKLKAIATPADDPNDPAMHAPRPKSPGLYVTEEGEFCSFPAKPVLITLVRNLNHLFFSFCSLFPV